MQFKDLKLSILIKEWIVMERGGWARQTLEEITAMVEGSEMDIVIPITEKVNYT